MPSVHAEDICCHGLYEMTVHCYGSPEFLEVASALDILSIYRGLYPALEE